MATEIGYYKCSPELYAKYLAAGRIIDTDFYYVEDQTLGVSKLYLGRVLLSNVEHLESVLKSLQEEMYKKVSIVEAQPGLYTIYGKRKAVTEGELYPEFEHGQECVFCGGYYPNDLNDFENGDRRVVMYGKKGTFSVDMAEDRGDTPEDKHVANRKFVLGKDAEVKQFVQDNYVKLDQPTEVGRSYVYRSYYHGGGKYTNNTVKATPASEQYTIMERDSGGRSSVEAPTSEKHIANKDYVDKAIADVKTTLEQKIKELEERLANL
jgi:hypothetical protein